MLSEAKVSPLDLLFEGREGVITELPEHCLLAPLGLRRGKSLMVKVRQPFGGPVIVEIEGREVALSRKIAREIKVIEEK